MRVIFTFLSFVWLSLATDICLGFGVLIFRPGFKEVCFEEEMAAGLFRYFSRQTCLWCGSRERGRFQYFVVGLPFCIFPGGGRGGGCTPCVALEVDRGVSYCAARGSQYVPVTADVGF